MNLKTGQLKLKSKEQTQKQVQKNVPSLRNLWHYWAYQHMCHNSQGKRRDKETEIIFKEITFANFPNLMKYRIYTYTLLYLLHFTLGDFADIAFFTNWRSVATLSLCHILVILTVFQTFLLYLLRCSVISDLWCYCCRRL